MSHANTTAAPDCEIGDIDCTNTNVERVEDPFEADERNNPGVMIWVCDECFHYADLDD